MINGKFAEACRRNDVCRLRALMEGLGGARVDVDKHDYHDQTPIFHAIENRALQSLEFLISKGADLHKTSIVSIKRASCTKEGFVKYHEPPLVTAARKADVQCLQLLLANGCKGDEFATVVEDMHTPREGVGTVATGVRRCHAVHHAVLRNEPVLLQALLEHGGQAEVKDHEERTPMHYACVCKKGQPSYCWDQVEILRLLLLHGGDPHVADRLSVTPLALAINYDCLLAVECLLSAGSSPPYQLCMVGLATLKNRHDIVMRLVNGGFKLNLLNSRFQTPIQTDVMHQPVGNIASTLIFHGCDVNCFDRPLHANSLLHQVMRGYRLDCEALAFLLVKAGYNLNQDTWLLHHASTNKPDKHQIFENSITDSSQVITAKQFFTPDTLNKFGEVKQFSIALGRMTVLRNYLVQELCNASRLTDLCRVVVRGSISRANGGVSVVGDIHLLPLPPSISSFLLFADVTTELEDGSIQVHHPF